MRTKTDYQEMITASSYPEAIAAPPGGGGTAGSTATLDGSWSATPLTSHTGDGWQTCLSYSG